MIEGFSVVAIDGGAGTGKSTTAAIVSERLNFLHVDTGAHYRSITKYLLDENLGLNEIENFFDNHLLELSSQVVGKRSILAINKRIYQVDDLRSEEVNRRVSEVATIPRVREILFDYQREQIEFARKLDFSGVVMEGRDIGSVILPDAKLKVFLVADQEVRESRRLNDGEIDQIASRDEIDSNRHIAPLIESAGSLRIDTSQLSVEEVFSAIRAKILA